ncbi:MAG: DUF1559 domain-containing protein [Verrucomicrobiota bacterium]
MQYQRPRAFTLVELLVVVAVLAILSALALSVMTSAFKSASQAQCSHNLRQLGTAIQTYAADHGNRFPVSTHTSGIRFTRAWQFQLLPYLGGSVAPNGTMASPGGAAYAYISPGDAQAEERRNRMAEGSLPNSSYLYNSFLEEARYNRFNKLSRPADVIVLFPASDTIGLSISNDHIHGTNWDKGWAQVIGDLQPNRFRSGGSESDKLNGSANYLFADGHVETIRADDLKARLDAGHNPARP